MATLYAFHSEAVQAEVIEPILASGEVDDVYGTFNVDLIAATVLQWEDGYDGKTFHVNQQGYILRPRFRDDPDAFWEVVQNSPASS
jgi:hypothetical protein